MLKFFWESLMIVRFVGVKKIFFYAGNCIFTVILMSRSTQANSSVSMPFPPSLIVLIAADLGVLKPFQHRVSLQGFWTIWQHRTLSLQALHVHLVHSWVSLIPLRYTNFSSCHLKNTCVLFPFPVINILLQIL